MRLFTKFCQCNFNPRSHERSDKAKRGKVRTVRNFNPRSHERSDATQQEATESIKKFQSTLPREERPNDSRRDYAIVQISIHAPTRGATAARYTRRGTYKIFQSTLPREERRFDALYNSMEKCNFNPRSHERSDLIMYRFNVILVLFQSTLPREERQRNRLPANTLTDFNPRSHERSDFIGGRRKAAR